MGEKDTITKNYMQDKTIFADAFNFLLYDGKQVIKPEQLKPVDTASLVLPYGDDGKVISLQKFRDVLKVATLMEDDNYTYLVLGIENQSEIHFAMPVKNMLYDAIQYSKQVEEAAKAHRKNKDSPESAGEFLSGFYRTDKLLPVITLTVYFGPDEWDAPKDLHSMLKAEPDVMKFIDNYHLHLIAPAEIKKSDFSKFHSELSLVMKYIKYSKDKKTFMENVGDDEEFQNVSKETADVINAVTGYDVELKTNERGNVNMCEAIKGIREDAWLQGRKEANEENARILAEKDEKLAEKDEKLAEKDEKLAEKDRIIAEMMIQNDKPAGEIEKITGFNVNTLKEIAQSLGKKLIL